ncbi:MAG: MFS transporter [Acidimicrobiales bacterium]
MTTAPLTLDSGPLTKTQRRIGLTAIGGYFVDGYDLLVLSGALLAIVPEMKLAPSQTGALTASAFAAMALGSVVSGPLTDRIGRRPVFFTTMIAFVIGSVATIFVTDLWHLIALRILIGFAIGADMPPSAALIAEFIPQRRRGTFTALGGVAWTAGGAVAIAVTLVLYSLSSNGSEPWRWALASGSIPAVILLFLRHNTPESPFWLVERGRTQDAVESWRYAHDRAADDTSVVLPPSHDLSVARGFRELFRRPFAVLVFCVAVYWGLNNLYGSAIVLYQPTLITRLLGTPSKYTPLLFTAAFQLIAAVFGLFVCLYLVESIGRRAVGIGATALVGLGGLVVYLGINSVPLTLFAFAVMIVLLNGGSSLVYYVWAPELFPTRIRGRAVGLINMVGKLGSVLSTLTLPTLFANVGNGIFLIIAAAAAINVAVIWLLAPETKGRSMADLESGSSALDQRRSRRKKDPATKIAA